jgi:RHS repeat-associated protein
LRGYYDDLYRLTEEVITDKTNGNRTSSYTYDAAGNRRNKTINDVKTTYTYDANDRLLNEKVNGATTASYTYDNNGSTLTKTENGVTTTYTWNDEKRLVSVTVGNTQQVEYTYNDQGIRVSSKVNGVETRYLLDEGITANVWEEYSPNGSVQASYVYGRDLITQIQGTQTSYYLVDGLGSTRLLTDTQGQILNSYGYEAFGEKINQSGSTDNKYQYAGEQFDAVLGDYYLRQRFYDTSSGRFGRMDTYEGSRTQPLTLNKYIYTSGNPINRVDPTGYFDFSLSSLTMAQKVGIILVTIGISGILANSSRRKGEHLDQPLEGFDLGRAPKVSDSISRWRDSWIPAALEGFGSGPQPVFPSHTGHSISNAGEIVTNVFSAMSSDDAEIISFRLSRGHAWNQGGRDSFWKKMGLDNRSKFQEYLKGVMTDPITEVRERDHDAALAFWDAKNRVMIVDEPSYGDGGSAFPSDYEYFKRFGDRVDL